MVVTRQKTSRDIDSSRNSLTAHGLMHVTRDVRATGESLASGYTDQTVFFCNTAQVCFPFIQSPYFVGVLSYERWVLYCMLLYLMLSRTSRLQHHPQHRGVTDLCLTAENSHFSLTTTSTTENYKSIQTFHMELLSFEVRLFFIPIIPNLVRIMIRGISVDQYNVYSYA